MEVNGGKVGGETVPLGVTLKSNVKSGRGKKGHRHAAGQVARLDVTEV